MHSEDKVKTDKYAIVVYEYMYVCDFALTHQNARCFSYMHWSNIIHRVTCNVESCDYH